MKYCTFWNVIVRGMKGNTVLPVPYTVDWIVSTMKMNNNNNYLVWRRGKK